MTITNDIVKGIRNPTPLYAVAGAADLAAEKLREVPPLIGRIREEAPERWERLRATDPRTVQARVSAQAKDAQARLNGTLAELNLREFRDLRRLGESVQNAAMQGVGRAAGAAAALRDTYDDLAVRGKDAMAVWRGEAAGEVAQIAAVMERDRRNGSGGAARRADGTGPAKRPAAARKTTPRRPAQ